MQSRNYRMKKLEGLRWELGSVLPPVSGISMRARAHTHTSIWSGCLLSAEWMLHVGDVLQEISQNLSAEEKIYFFEFDRLCSAYCRTFPGIDFGVVPIVLTSTCPVPLYACFSAE
jgi:hypothetical protein